MSSTFQRVGDILRQQVLPGIVTAIAVAGCGGGGGSAGMPAATPAQESVQAQEPAIAPAPEGISTPTPVEVPFYAWTLAMENDAVLLTVPSGNDSGIDTGTVIAVAYNGLVDPETSVQATLSDGSSILPSHHYVSAGTVVVVPQQPLLAETRYTVSVAAIVKTADGSGSLVAVQWAFTTGPTP